MVWLQEKVKFIWTDVHTSAFERIKEALVSAPCLVFPSREGDFILDTDASDVAIGAELVQIQDGKERVVSYASHALTKPQKRYCTTRKELLAVVKLCRHFRHYFCWAVGLPFEPIITAWSGLPDSNRSKDKMARRAC